jgi:hypothetical protein
MGPFKYLLLVTLVAFNLPLKAADQKSADVHLPTWSQQIAIREGWLVERHALILDMMRRHRIDMWIVVNEEFHNDPLTEYIAPPRPYTFLPRQTSYYLIHQIACALQSFQTAESARTEPSPPSAGLRKTAMQLATGRLECH